MIVTLNGLSSELCSTQKERLTQQYVPWLAFAVKVYKSRLAVEHANSCSSRKHWVASASLVIAPSADAVADAAFGEAGPAAAKGGAPHSKDDLVMHIIAPLKWRESVMMLFYSVHNEHIKVIAILTLALSINPMWPLKVISSRPSFNSYNKF